MYYLVYKVTNTVNGKFYIGCHKTLDKNDGYMGSGKAIKYAIKKYGEVSFKKDLIIPEGWYKGRFMESKLVGN